MSGEITPEELDRLRNRWRSDMDKKVDRLVAFADHYQPLLDLLTERERERAKLRRAVIEKTLAGLAWAALVFVILATKDYVKRWIHH